MTKNSVKNYPDDIIEMHPTTQMWWALLPRNGVLGGDNFGDKTSHLWIRRHQIQRSKIAIQVSETGFLGESFVGNNLVKKPSFYRERSPPHTELMRKS